jgi:fatty acid desaturase
MGRGCGERARVVTPAELAAHAARDSCWVQIEGKARGARAGRPRAPLLLTRACGCARAPAQQVYDVTRWLDSHPGGQLPLLSLGGRDATDAFASFHAAWVGPAKLAAFEVGVAAPPGADAQPPGADAAPPGSDADAAYRALRAQLEREGLFRPTLRFYLAQLLWVSALFAAVVRLTASQHAPLRLAAALLLGLFWQQVAFIGHDAGHAGITGVRSLDHAIGLLCGNALTGIELGWWQSTHNVHHAVPNSAEHDADVQHLPFMAVSELMLRGVHSRYHGAHMACGRSQRALLAWQAWYFFPVLTIARYGLLLQGVKSVGWEWGKRHSGFASPGARWARPVQAAALAVFYAYAAWLLARLRGPGERLLFTYLSGATFAMLHLQINLSHWSQRVLLRAPPGGWVDTQLAATLNWRCPAWLDWFHGGLQFQIEHHLFPRLPRARLRAVAPRVRALCAAHGVPYRQLGFREATAEVLATLASVGRAAAELNCKGE